MFRFEQTAVGNLLRQRLEEQDLSARTLIERVGYSNITKGLRRLEALCSYAEGTAEFVEHVATVLEIPLGELQTACAETRQVFRDEEERVARERFRPFLSIKTPGLPTMPLFAAAMLWSKVKQIQLPKDIPTWKLDEQLQHVRQLVALHHQREKGVVWGFGKITGYIYHQTYDHRIAFSVRGEVVEPFAPPQDGPPELSLGGRPFPVSFFTGGDHG